MRLRAVAENHFIPLNRFDGIVETRDRAAAEISARRVGWSKDCGFDFFFRDDATHRALPEQLII